MDNLIKNLTHKGFIPHFCKNENEANDLVMALIPSGDTVGIGGSITITEMGTHQLLADNNRTVYCHSLVPKEQIPQLHALARSANWYMSSANALTKKGDIINIDGTGNRVSSLIFGVPNIIYIVGKNKIVDTLEDGIDRIRNYSCHLNAVRLKKNTPCFYTGKCGDCTGYECMCNVTSIMHHPTRLQQQVHIIIVDKNLGY